MAKQRNWLTEKDRVFINTLTPERQAELIAHFHQCEIPFLTCPLCEELYENIGYSEYGKLAMRYTEDVELI